MSERWSGSEAGATTQYRTYLDLQHVADDLPQVLREGAGDAVGLAGTDLHRQSDLVGGVKRRAVERQAEEIDTRVSSRR